MIVVVPVLPASILTELELAEIPKSCMTTSVTLTATVVVCKSDPLIPVIVIM